MKRLASIITDLDFIVFPFKLNSSTNKIYGVELSNEYIKIGEILPDGKLNQIEIYNGESYTFPFTFKDSSGTPINITG